MTRAGLEWRWQIGTDTRRPGPGREGATEANAARKQALESSRERARKLLRADPAATDKLIGAEAGCAYNTVRRLRERMVKAGEITEPGYRTGADGKRYMSTGNGRPGSPRVTLTEGTARRPAHVVAKRERIAAALAEHPTWSHHRIGTELDVAHDTVKSVCRETIPSAECRHQAAGQGAGRAPIVRGSVVAKLERIAAAVKEHPIWSHNKIAVDLGVHPATVRKVCRESGLQCGHLGGYDGRGQRRQPADQPKVVTAKQERVTAALAEHPTWSHNRIALALDVSAPTVRKVCRESGGECGHRATDQGVPFRRADVIA